MKKITIPYATRSEFKQQEIRTIESSCYFTNEDGEEQIIGERFYFTFADVETDEPLEVDLVAMVKHKAVSAYRKLLMPCIVEHAGLILVEHSATSYPGGLTQPMMDALGAAEFVRRTSAAGEQAIARAVIGYCDGMSVRTFIGETKGKIAASPRGDRQFYWDTIFEPEGYGGDTYAEITSDAERGIAEKMKVSQSMKALRKFLQYKLNTRSALFDF